MSMRLAVTCPFCKRPMATSAAFTGQMIACPSCRGEFLLNPPAQAPSQMASPLAPPPAQRLETPFELASPIAVAAPPVSAPPTTDHFPTPPPNTARFKTAASATPAIAASADGKLPELQLADAALAGSGGESGEKAVPLWLAVLAIM